jgi:hypothetical protein
VVQTLAAEGPDHSFGDGVRLGRTNGRGDGVDPDPFGTPAEIAAIDRIPIA